MYIWICGKKKNLLWIEKKYSSNKIKECQNFVKKNLKNNYEKNKSILPYVTNSLVFLFYLILFHWFFNERYHYFWDSICLLFFTIYLSFTLHFVFFIFPSFISLCYFSFFIFISLILFLSLSLLASFILIFLFFASLFFHHFRSSLFAYSFLQSSLIFFFLRIFPLTAWYAQT